MYSKTKAAMVSSLALIVVAMLFATGPLVVNHAFAYGYHHYYHHSHHHSQHHYNCTSYDYKHHYHNCYKDNDR